MNNWTLSASSYSWGLWVEMSRQFSKLGLTTGWGEGHTTRRQGPRSQAAKPRGPRGALANDRETPSGAPVFAGEDVKPTARPRQARPRSEQLCAARRTLDAPLTR